MLVPEALGHPLGWYRLLTYSFVHAGLRHWLVVASVTLVSGWLAERWLAARAMCVIACIAALVGGALYALLAPPRQPVIGGGLVAAGFAGAAVAASALRRRAISRGMQLVALVLLPVYGLSALRADAQSLATLGAFIAAGGYAAWRLTSLGDTPAGVRRSERSTSSTRAPWKNS
jgi:membrane associated rhomboid family serine protease